MSAHATALDSQRKPRILIIEDEPLIALDVKEMLEDAGFEIVGLASTLDQALSLIRSEFFEAAIVDANLAGISANPAAMALIARGLPYLVLSGYSIEQQPAALQTAPFVAKPADPFRLVQVLHSILPTS